MSRRAYMIEIPREEMIDYVKSHCSPAVVVFRPAVSDAIADAS